MGKPGTAVRLSDIVREILVYAELQKPRIETPSVKLNLEDVLIQPCRTSIPDMGTERCSRCPRPSKKQVTIRNTELGGDVIGAVIKKRVGVVQILDANNRKPLILPVSGLEREAIGQR